MRNPLIPYLLLIALSGCTSNAEKKTAENKPASICNDANCTNKIKSMNTNFTCKLTTPELQQRKATVLESLRKQVMEKKELENGFAFKFNGSDQMIDELTTFAKTERQCCDFFTFNISVTGDTSAVWLGITGAPGIKDFIESELEL